MLIIFITVGILEIFLVDVIRKNYYKNLEDNLINQIKISSDIYAGYFSDASLNENVLNNVDAFWKQTPAQVQIIDLNRKVIMDSIGVLPMSVLETEDVIDALNGKTGKWIGKVSYHNVNVLAVSTPLKSGDSIVGVLRFVTSLKEVNNAVNRIARVFMIIGAIVILVCGLFSLILANSIIGPLKDITDTAVEMASGNFKKKCSKKHDDEIGKLADTLNYMADEIVKKEELKNDFISSVSHELRTPLTSIKGWAVTLKSGNMEDSSILMDGLNIIEVESDRLSGMVEELLDFSRFVSHKVVLSKEKVDVNKLMEHLKTQLKPRAARDNIEFTVTCQENVPVIISDENRLKQVFINILDNAFKYTPAGGKISFTSEITENKLVFIIRDTGAGIASDEIPKIKEKFYKGKNSKPGSGIGLSVCDELTKLMGYRLEIKSELDIGTEVYITVPLGEDEKFA